MAKRVVLGRLGYFVGLMVVVAQPVMAAPIPLGDFAGATVEFLNVVADDGTQIGPAVLNGDSLEFSPRLSASSSAGTSASTPATLTLGLSAQPGFVLNTFSSAENGLFSLFGGGSGATTAQAATNMQVTIDEVDGNPIAPINNPVNVIVGFNLAANPGLDQPWSTGVTANIMAALIASGVPFSFGATHVLVTWSNTLTTQSEPNSSAAINKDAFRVSATTTPIAAVPEPATTGLAILGLALTAVYRRSRRR